MSDTAIIVAPAAPEEPPSKPTRRSQRQRLRVVVICAALTIAGEAAYWSFSHLKQWNGRKSDDIPTTKVEKADVSFNINSKGELRGGNPETLIAPATGGNELHVIYLAKNGAQVKPGDVIVKFDTSEQEY